VRHVFKLGLDVDLHYCVTAIQCDHGTLKPAQKLTRPQLVKWVREQTAAGHAVHTVYEACGFGYPLHEELTAAGAVSLVTTPMRLSPERRRKNDRLDVRPQPARRPSGGVTPHHSPPSTRNFERTDLPT
jgi:hypothetical protein